MKKVMSGFTIEEPEYIDTLEGVCLNQSVTCSSCGWVGTLNEGCDVVDIEEDELIYSVPICPECEAILEI